MTQPTDIMRAPHRPHLLDLFCPLHECGDGPHDEDALADHVSEEHSPYELLLVALAVAREDAMDDSEAFA